MDRFFASQMHFLHPAPAEALNGSGPEPGDQGRLRFFNASSAPFPIHILLDDLPFAAGCYFPSFTSYAPAGPGSCRVLLLNGQNPSVRLLETLVSLEPGAYVSAVIADSRAQGLQLLPFADQPPADSGGGCFLRAVNTAMEDQPLCLCRQDGLRICESLPFSSASPYIRLSPGPADFYAAGPGGQDGLLSPLASLSLTLRPGRSYSLYLAGSLWLPEGLRLLAAEDG